MEEKIKKLGKSFRGLWVSHTFEPEVSGLTEGWAVTFIRDRDYCESPYFDTPHKALDFALRYADIINP